MGFFLLSYAFAADPDPSGHDIPVTAAPAPVARAADPAPPAADPAPAGSDPATFALDPAARREQAANLYVKGLDAWKSGKHSRAWRLASEALALDPDLTPARLLAGYALLRLRRGEEGVTTLGGLDLEPGLSPLPPATLRSARRILRRHALPYRRDQWWVAVGNITFIERLGDTGGVLNGYSFSGQAPIVENLAVRVDAVSPWGGTADALDVRGARFDVMAVAEERIDKGLWHVDLAAGPAFWAATGRYWADGWQPYIGVRAALGVDVRLGAAMGLRYEMGASAYPTAAEDLSWYAEPLDIRVALQVWFGK
jgi:hypothetical protein